jgi:hypothetical protein
MDKKLVLIKKTQNIMKHLIPTIFFISLLLFKIHHAGTNQKQINHKAKHKTHCPAHGD